MASGPFAVECVYGVGTSVPAWVSRSSEVGSSRTFHLEDLGVHDATFTTCGLTTFCWLDDLGTEALGQRLEPERAVLACQIVEAD